MNRDQDEAMRDEPQGAREDRWPVAEPPDIDGYQPARTA